MYAVPSFEYKCFWSLQLPSIHSRLCVHCCEKYEAEGIIDFILRAGDSAIGLAVSFELAYHWFFKSMEMNWIHLLKPRNGQQVDRFGIPATRSPFNFIRPETFSVALLLYCSMSPFRISQ